MPHTATPSIIHVLFCSHGHRAPGTPSELGTGHPRLLTAIGLGVEVRATGGLEEDQAEILERSGEKGIGEKDPCRTEKGQESQLKNL